jgi:hypothetical protein
MSGKRSSVEEWLKRAAQSLDEHVLPHVENHYARLQVRALGEMLRNLGTRVDWRESDLDANKRAAQQALQTLSTIQGHAPVSGESLAELRKHLATRIGSVYDAALPEPQRDLALAAIWRVVRSEFDAEAGRIRTGMYS